MKKVLLATAITVLGFATINAQDVTFGAKLGINFASIYGDNTKDIETVTAFNFGVMSEIAISKKFSFQPELLYSGLGYSLDDEDTASLNYLSIPLMGKYYITDGLSLEAGPQIGFLLSAKQDGTDIKDSFKTLDFGANLGVGYKLDNGLNFNARYTLGLSNINDIEGSSDKNTNGVLQFGIGYFFN